MRLLSVSRHFQGLASPVSVFSSSAASKAFIRPLDLSPPAGPASSSPGELIAAPAQPTRPSAISSDDFLLYPDFFSPAHTRQLLAMSLAKLDSADSVVKRRKRLIKQGRKVPEVMVGGGPLQDLFDQEYDFHEGHYDSVIHHYRESLLSTFPTLTASSTWPDYRSLMTRIYDLLLSSSSGEGLSVEGLVAPFPPTGSTTHVLHLAPHGDIQAHVDNVDASGSIIIGVSLGAPRILRLKRAPASSRSIGSREGDQGDVSGWDVLLPSGSLYLQRDAVRYNYEHSILAYDDPGSHWDGVALEAGHRLSLMVRDRPSTPPG